MGLAVPLFAGEDWGGVDGEVRDARRERHLRAVGGGPEAGDDRPVRVVLVEDDAAMRLLCTFNLEAAGFEVVAATTGRDGVELARTRDPDVVLLDVMLPDLGGFEVAQQLKGVPVIFMSARASQADLARGRAAGAIDYVTKPFDPVALPDRVREDLEELKRSGTADSVWTLRFRLD